MPVIVFEGPDESGKTTFAKALASKVEWIKGMPTTYQVSPLRDNEWAPGHQTFLIQAVEIWQDQLLIQDRIPEISETVYGTMRDHTRGRGWFIEAFNWLREDIMLVFCKGPSSLKEDHTDNVGGHISQNRHYAINKMYDHIWFNFHQACTHGHPHHFETVRYNRFEPHNWIKVMDRISHWLQYQFPNQAGVIEATLDYGLADPFPFAEEKE